MKYDNAQWAPIDSAAETFSIRSSGSYCIVKDLSMTLMPHIVDSELKQNYPNPFNPETTIGYSIASPGNVTLEIYNTRGQMIKVLVDEYKDTGKYEVQWNGKDHNGRELPSGVYYYKLVTNGKHVVKKMILLK